MLILRRSRKPLIDCSQTVMRHTVADLGKARKFACRGMRSVEIAILKSI